VQVRVTNILSTDLELSDSTDIPPREQKASMLVAEIIGTLLLGESQLTYIEDARQRLLRENAIILPAAGIQSVPTGVVILLAPCLYFEC
jgi:predicted RNA methylase